LDFIRPGKPEENHYIESFNERLCDECLNTHLFFDLLDAQGKLDQWKWDYNHTRAHSPLGKRTPEEFALKQKTNRNNKTKQGKMAVELEVQLSIFWGALTRQHL